MGRLPPLLVSLIVSQLGSPLGVTALGALALGASACARPVALSEPAAQAAGADEAPRKAWAIAIHGGAGTIPRTLPGARAATVRAGLSAALTAGRDQLKQGWAAVDVVEAVIRVLEDDARFNAGRGAVLNADGKHELDASIMDGRTLACGAVAGVATVRHPITAARRIMTQTRHVLLSGAGAETFAKAQGLELVDNAWFTTEERRAAWERLRPAPVRMKRPASDAPASSEAREATPPSAPPRRAAA